MAVEHIGGDHGVAHTAHTIAMYSSIVVATLGILLSATVYYWKKISAETLAQRLKGVHTVLWNKYYFDELYGAIMM